MSILEGGRNYSEYRVAKKVGGDTTFYEVDKESKTHLIIAENPDDFFVGWPSGLSNEQFFRKASEFIDELDRLPLPSRRIELDNPAHVAVAMEKNAAEIVVPPSYTGFGFDNVYLAVGGKNVEIDFTETELPLGIAGLKNTIDQKAGEQEGIALAADDLTDSAAIYARVNAPNCNLVFDRSDNEYSHNALFNFPTNTGLYFWSDRYPKEELTKLYEETASHPIPIALFTDQLDAIVGDKEVKKKNN